MASGDAIDKSVHLDIVDIMNFIVKTRIGDTFYMEKYKEYSSIGREAVQEKIKNWATKIKEEE